MLLQRHDIVVLSGCFNVVPNNNEKKKYELCTIILNRGFNTHINKEASLKIFTICFWHLIIESSNRTTRIGFQNEYEEK